MSGCSYESSCPNCSNHVSEYSDHKPFAITVIGPCMSCGFYTETSVKYLTLEELNKTRQELNELNEYEDEDKPQEDQDFLLPLTKLPEQDKDL